MREKWAGWNMEHSVLSPDGIDWASVIQSPVTATYGKRKTTGKRQEASGGQ